MEMHQVKYFLVLSETLNFTRAAERCNVAQPSLTRAIRLLEEELGGPLFNRERNNTHLTELGRLVTPHLETLWEQARTARIRANAFFELRTARLKLGIARGVALRLVDGTLQCFAETYPETEIVLLDDHASPLKETLRRGDLEVVVLPQRTAAVDDLHYYPIAQERAEVLMRADHPFADLPAVPLRALVGERLIGRDQCLVLEAAARQLHEEGLLLRPRVVADSAEWLPVLVEDGLGVAVTTSRFDRLPGLVARPIVDLVLDHHADLATKRGRPYSPPVKAFVDLALRPARRAQPAGGARAATATRSSAGSARRV
jgi:LysR family hydrogen peroxide-inducible transcriptional activator